MEVKQSVMSPLDLMSESKTPQARVGDVFVEIHHFTRIHRFSGLSALTYSRGRFRISINWLIPNMIIIGAILIMNVKSLFTTRKLMSYQCSSYYYLNIALLIKYIYGVVAHFIENNRKVNLLNTCLFNIRAVDLVLFTIGEQRPTVKLQVNGLFAIVLIVTAFILRLKLHPPLHEAIDIMASILLLSFKSLRQSLLKCSKMEEKDAAILAEKLIYCHHKLCNSDSSLVADKYTVIAIKGLWSVLAMTVLWQMSKQFASIRNEVRRIVCTHIFQRKVPYIDEMVDRESDYHQLCIDNKREDLFYNAEGNMIQCVRKVDLLNRCLLNIRAVDLVLFSIGERRPATRVHFNFLFVMVLIVTTFTLRLHLHRIASILLLSFKSLRQSIEKCSGVFSSAQLAEKLIHCHHKLCNSSRIVCAHLYQRKVPNIDKMVDREPDYHQLCIDNKREDLFYNAEGDFVPLLTVLLLEHRSILVQFLWRHRKHDTMRPESGPPQQMSLKHKSCRFGFVLYWRT
ncbi:unnamed protein product [Nezara viridula]|uniref:Uncharacterized protein n=1 Tax=Nezara viridula TaxID=85310 RepID=A0A9P0EI85_NEZVI|nr:unnamed protein product [Nezara viridula]